MTSPTGPADGSATAQQQQAAEQHARAADAPPAPDAESAGASGREPAEDFVDEGVGEAEEHPAPEPPD
ncbi:MAG: hypothetical protein ACT4P1_03105 [Sporichthyaceae bacterium]